MAKARRGRFACPDCGQAIDDLKTHVRGKWFGHRKAKARIKRARKRQPVTRQHPTIGQAARQRAGTKQFEKGPEPHLDGWLNQSNRQQPWNKPGRPVGKRVARQVRKLEHDRYWED